LWPAQAVIATAQSREELEPAREVPRVLGWLKCAPVLKSLANLYHTHNIATEVISKFMKEAKT